MKILKPYQFSNVRCCGSHDYLLPVIKRVLGERRLRIFDLGCGNGSVAHWLSQQGHEVHGVDPSETGIAIANRSRPDLDLQIGTSDEDLAGRFGTFQAVVSLEVIEHVYSAQTYARTVFDLLEPGGEAIISTPYHGWLKNVAIALAGKFDWHVSSAVDGGHIKFWSAKSLSRLLESHGFVIESVYRVGRIPPLAKSMIVVAKKPA
jgi:2-polyprenyl-6-hydroxyphenyl methylase/3-demethylubiquinone-9 3-methyltransferase